MSFEQLTIGEWVIEVDRQTTRETYLKEQPITCSCLNCQNYLAACLAGLVHTPAMVALFEDLGITPEKGAEVHVLIESAEKLQACYGGFYHLVGRISRQPENGQERTPIDDWFQVTFTEETDLLSPGFPSPALQMDFFGAVPWVLTNSGEELSGSRECDAPLETIFQGLHWRP